MAKNNKKSFSDDLESLFEYTLYEDNPQDNLSVLPGEKKSSKKKETVAEEDDSNNDNKRVSSRKSFSEDLESFFKESIEEAMGGTGTTVSEIKRNVVKDKKGKRAIGIDILLQRTLFKKDEEEESENSSTKRVTFVLEKENIEKLKAIARNEKKQMRQIISKLIDEYLKKKRK